MRANRFDKVVIVLLAALLIPIAFMVWSRTGVLPKVSREEAQNASAFFTFVKFLLLIAGLLAGPGVLAATRKKQQVSAGEPGFGDYDHEDDDREAFGRAIEVANKAIDYADGANSRRAR